jgi:hypothetical protein
MKTKYIRLSEHLSNIAQGYYWDSKVLKRVMKSPLLNDEDRLILKWYSKGIKIDHFLIQDISIKLYLNKS